MPKLLSINALEEIVQESVSLHGDNWANVNEHINARLRTMPETCLADIDKELRAIVSGAQHSATSEFLQ